MNRSAEIFRLSQEIIPGGVNSPVRAFQSVGGTPFVVDRAQGPYLFDVDGNRYVDYICSWGPMVLGHAHPRIVQALHERAQMGTSYGAPCELELELAQKVQQLMPNIEMIRFVNSGTEACMSVVRVARAFTKRNKIIKFSGCFHGHADMLLVEAGSGVSTLGLPGTIGIPKQSTQDTLTAPYNSLEGVEQLFKQFPDEIAAVILEPIVGNSGFIKPRPGFLEGLRTITEKYSSLLIFDEVMTGFRVHLGGAQTLYDIQPDLTTLGKVIGGGLPVGAYGGRKDIMSLVAPAGPVYQSGTLSGNPLAMVAGLETLREWSKPGVFDETAKIAKTISRALLSAAKSNDIAFQSDFEGSMFGFFFNSEPVYNFETAKASDMDRFKAFFHAMLKEGVYFAPSAFEGAFVSAAHAGEALDHTLTSIKKVFSTLQ